MTLPNSTADAPIRQPTEGEQGEMMPMSEEQNKASSCSTTDSDDDDVTVILLDTEPTEGGATSGGAGAVALDWIEQQGPEMEARRRTILLRELQRTQRVSFCHFLVLCAVPIVLLIILLTAILSESEECSSEVTYCEYEPRTFNNAFTTRCVCDPIPITRSNFNDRL